MGRIVSLLLVAAIAFAAGAAGANGTLTRMLADAHIIGSAPTATPSPSLSTQAAPTAAASLGTAANTEPPSATATDNAPANATATAHPSDTPAPTASPTQTPLPKTPAVLSLGQTAASGAALAASGWVGNRGLTITVMAPPSTMDLRAEVEVRPVSQPFSGAATAFAPVIHGVASVPLKGLSAGRYHWQARLTSATGVSGWRSFAHGGTAFGVQLSAPAAPAISSASDPRQDKTYATSEVSFSWPAPTDPSGIAGYSYRLDTNPHGEALPAVRTQAQRVTLGGLGTGSYYFHLRAVNGVGNWGPSSTYAVHVDVTPPQILHTHASGFYVNPAVESLTLSYQLSKVSHVTVGIYKSPYLLSDRIRHLVPKQLMPAGVPLTITWDGRDDKGNIVPPGVYNIYLRATDRLGNTNLFAWGGYNVTDKRILVSLTQQRLWAFEGQRQILTTLVTTGNKELPTPTGIFHVMFAKHPFTFISPWPKGSKYYYPPSPVKYALYFKDYGYYIHDAPWRGVFGPGSNALSGTPGGNNTGTHGCVNVPEPVMAQLYAWAAPGTTVQIVQ